MIDEITLKCKKALVHYYGAQLKGLILYGSAARGQTSLESDIDLLVLLNGPFDYFQELRRIVELLYPIQLESDYLISAKPAAVDSFETGDIQLYRAIKQDGIAL